MLGWELEEAKLKPQQTQLFVELTEEEKVLFRYLKDQEKVGLDTIALACKVPTFKAATLLLSLELKGVVRPLPGKLFQLV